ncbi:MAG: response regulator [Chloroflexota bacterium]
MHNTARKEHILVVARDEKLSDQISETLHEAGGYTVSVVNTFEDALSEILLTDFNLVVTQAELPDLSGMDLLAVIGGLRPNARVVVIDDDLSPKSAVAVYRLGAVDYLYKPLNMSFFLMQVERHLEAERMKRRVEKKTGETPPEENNFQERAKRLDPTTRSAALVLKREQFDTINIELTRLLNHVKASFVGLVDADGNMVGAAGTLEDYDLQLLSSALNIDHATQRSLASILEENKFHSTYFEGEKSGVYIIEFGAPYIVSLAVICRVAGSVVAMLKTRSRVMSWSLVRSVPVFRS